MDHESFGLGNPAHVMEAALGARAASQPICAEFVLSMKIDVEPVVSKDVMPTVFTPTIATDILAPPAVPVRGREGAPVIPFVPAAFTHAVATEVATVPNSDMLSICARFAPVQVQVSVLLPAVGLTTARITL